ncbi:MULTISPECIES: glutathione S-transferase family protein [unclassified Chelatococcus]|uniref:glutathione S-transferase family protein n=1 Tax=unclassified Chelatococcus TaxID=2638111 RepID=UPI00031708C2|nr:MULTISPECIES: glutathione S-transferase N-terminal domain-containing protein [unclassified Chelatococcus]ALA19634.1 glutathione S-transferase [Chelatococcus sp. CO-6]
MTPLQLYTYQTPNGHKASIMLEEIGLPYDVHIVDIENGRQTAPEFLALNPNNKIPVIVDPDRDRTVFESGAILHYLAERSGVLLPGSDAERIQVLSWTLFQAAHVGPTLGQLWNYKIFAPERIPYVIDRFAAEANRIFRVLNGQLKRQSHIAGEAYGIADVMTWPWIHAGLNKLGLALELTPNLARWYSAVGARPAVQRGLLVPRLPRHESAVA